MPSVRRYNEAEQESGAGCGCVANWLIVRGWLMSVRSDLKHKLQSGETIVAPGAYDPMPARLVQSLGFDTIYTGGW